MNTANKNKILILIAIGVLLTAGVLFFLTRTEYANILDLKRTYQDKSTQFTAQQKKLSALEKLNQDSNEMQNIESYATAQLPNSLEGSIFVASLEKLGNTMQVTPLSVSVSSAAVSSKDKNAPSAYNFSVTFNTNFQNLINFLGEMEKLDRFNSINNLSISPGDKGLGINLSGNIYQYKTVK